MLEKPPPSPTVTKHSFDSPQALMGSQRSLDIHEGSPEGTYRLYRRRFTGLVALVSSIFPAATFAS